MDEMRRRAVILLVAADPGQRELAACEFRRATSRNELHVAEDGLQALDYLLRRGRFADPACAPRPDLVLLDLDLPGKTGSEVLAEVQRHTELRQIPIVVMAASDQEADVVDCYALGAHGYMVKPLEVARFERALATLQHYWLQLVVSPTAERAERIGR